jgi:hypothetical protein
MVWKRRPELLLCPNIPKPLHGVAPRVVLGNSWWNKTRKEAYARTNYRCMACGVHKYRAKYREWLEAHEVYDIDYERGRSVFVEAVPLCHFCHNFIHDGRLNMLLQAGKIPHGKFAAIMQHGERILSAEGLTKPPHSVRDQQVTNALLSGRFANWSDWRMIVAGVEYPPLFTSYEDWLANHHEKQTDE